jgi:hypothetical protein
MDETEGIYLFFFFVLRSEIQTTVSKFKETFWHRSFGKAVSGDISLTQWCPSYLPKITLMKPTQIAFNTLHLNPDASPWNEKVNQNLSVRMFLIFKYETFYIFEAHSKRTSCKTESCCSSLSVSCQTHRHIQRLTGLTGHQVGVPEVFSVCSSFLPKPLAAALK